jgi:tetratricopeptide (TPR) repeat protein/predicted Ser/Thr protein kinase
VHCLDVETIVAFVEARMAPEGIPQMEAHFVGCAACRERLSLAVAASGASRNSAFGSRRAAGKPAKAVEVLARGTTIGRYTVLEVLGRGGMGEVYTAYDPELDRRIALKILHRGDDASDDRNRSRLLREAKAIAKLRHPNVVVVHDAGTIDERVFLAMEHIDGQTLAAWLAERPRQRGEILDIFRAAGRGLAAAHAAGLVHRDFKPQNVMVGRDGDVRVMDFGLAQAIDAEPEAAESAPPVATGNEPPPSAGPLTRTGELVGTPLYMAPEQFRAQRTDARTDQFAFCVALYQALYDAHPFASAGLGELMASVTAGRVQPPPAKNAVPPSLRRVLLRGLAVDPAARWPSMEALGAALAHDPARIRRRWLASAAAGVLLAGGAWALRAPHRAPAMCQGGPNRLAGAWELPDGAGHARRDATRAAFVRTGAAGAEQKWERAAQLIDTYSTDWLRMYGDACEATQVRGEQSAQVLDLRMSCLADRLARVKALADVLADANASIVDNAAEAATALPSLDRCADVPLLRAVVPPPDDRRVRDKVEALRRDLAHVRALGDSGQCAAAAAAGRQLVTDAEKIGYLPLLAESLNAAATPAGMECMKPEEMLALNRRAALAGVASHDEEAAAEGAILVAYLEGDRFSDVRAARDWIDVADAILRGMKHTPPTLEAYRLKALLLINEKEGDVDKALAIGEQARKLIERTKGVEHLDYAGLLNDIGVILVAKRRFGEALPYYRQAEEITLRIGSEHPQVGLVVVNEAEALNALGRYDEARVAAARALDVFRRGGSATWYPAWALTLLGEAQGGLGRTSESILQLEKATELFGDDRSSYASEARFDLARALWPRPGARRRSLALAHAAQDAYQRLADGKPQAAEVSAWLAAREGGRARHTAEP